MVLDLAVLSSLACLLRRRQAPEERGPWRVDFFFFFQILMGLPNFFFE
jgi:hypothetical protein